MTQEAKALKQMRQKVNFSTREVARLAGVSHATVINAEHGRKVTAKTIGRLVRFYGGNDLAKKAGICTVCMGSGRAKNG